MSTSLTTGSVATVVSHRVVTEHGFTVYLVTVKIRRTGEIVELPVDDITDQY
jgi:hypothetical protein